MKKFLTFIIVFLLSFMCMKGTMEAKITATLKTSKGKDAEYSLTSSFKYTKVWAEVGAGVSKAEVKWNDDGISGTLYVTFSSPDCVGDVTLKYNADEGCDNTTPKDCQALLDDARSMKGKIPYEMGGKCSAKDYESCKFGTKYTDEASYNSTRAMINANGQIRAYSPAYTDNLKRYDNSYALTGLDCSGFVWWIFYRNGYDLVGRGNPLQSSAYSGVSNITADSPLVYPITKEEAKPCDLVTSKKPENHSIPHVGIVSQTPAEGGWSYVHENGSNANVAENDYFLRAETTLKLKVHYWRVKALWDGGTEITDGTCNGAEPLHLDNHELCTCETCDSIKITDDYLDPEESKINNCCVDGSSHIKEYSISELFCSDEDYNTKVKYYKDQCNNDLYEDDALKSLGNDYCKIYCTEELDLTTPKPIESATGKFFKLAELTYTDLDGNEKTTKAPVIGGKKTCTIKINYDKWRKDYENSIIAEVAEYNTMQENLAYYNMLKDPKVTTKNLDQEINIACTSKTDSYRIHTKHVDKNGTYLDKDGKTNTCTADGGCDVDDYVAKDSDYTDSNGNTGKCGSTPCANHEAYKPTKTEKVSCTNTYTEYEINRDNKATAIKNLISCTDDNCSITYQQVKVNASFLDGSSYNGLKIESDGTKKATYSKITAKAGTDNCTAAADNKISEESGGWSCEKANPVKSIPDGVTEADMTAEAQHYYEIAISNNDSNAKNLSSYTASATTLEDAMTKCQTMFHDKSLAAEDGTSHETSNYFKLNPSTKFKYLQVYLNNNVKNKDWSEIDYGPAKCDYRFKNTHVEDIDDVDQYWSTDKYKKGSEVMIDLKPSEDFITKSDDIPVDDAKTIEKKFRQDAEYDAQCNWDDAPVPEEITLYPGPQVKEITARSGEVLITKHKYQYALYVTTYVTEYETYWELTDIGGSQRTKDKFIKAFNDAGGTCAENGVAYSDGGAEVRESTNAKNTCFIKVKDGGMRIGSCNRGIGDIDEYCEDNDVREVFEFRIVDPRAIFPSGDWSDKAHNWKKDDGSWGNTKKLIEDTAAQDLTYSKDNLTYSFRLTTTTLKAIKDYNDTTTYDDFDLSCTCPDESDIDNSGCGTIDKPVSSECTFTEDGRTKWKYTCRKCKSDFLKNLAVNNKVGTTTVTASWNNKDTIFTDVQDHKNHWA